MTNPTKPVKGLRVICDGTTNGTKVLDSQGNPIGMVQALQINIDCNEQIPTMTLKLAFSELDITIPEDGVEVELNADIPIVSSEEV